LVVPNWGAGVKNSEAGVGDSAFGVQREKRRVENLGGGVGNFGAEGFCCGAGVRDFCAGVLGKKRGTAENKKGEPRMNTD